MKPSTRLSVILALFCLLIKTTSVTAQVGIGTTTPDGNAMLEVVSPNKGILIPRILKADREAIATPATGLMVYQTDGKSGFYFYHETEGWKLVSSELVPAPASDPGFSATLNALTTNASTQLTGWSVTAPSYTATGFNPTTGNYTVPETGTYAIETTINYNLTTTTTVNLGVGINPYFEVRKTVPATSSIISGYLPMLNVNIILVLTLKAILDRGVVTLSRNVNLTAGDVLGLFYQNNGFTPFINIGGGLTPGVSWAIRKL
ncbi:hypothetical protein [Dyadobacter sp. LHD-138]|uniref:hypothetical protein n=1 Tax=Dyadobacter sp. LHD-138 TaxID=3071413 RepID=UPI0027E12A43|nr:hypothetical protein [Dyadobacter sp. LHD-138]MDQ6481315.1 hypothetical protein [Dyadobacter sp. LHD-138]